MSEKDNELAELKRQLSILQTQVLKYSLTLQFIFSLSIHQHKQNTYSILLIIYIPRMQKKML